MIWPLVVASALLTGQLRLFLGPAGAAVPCAAFAWTLLAARRSQRGSFVGTALLAALVEGPTFDAPYVALPIAALAVGAAGSLTRRLFPVRRPRGEIALGTAFAAFGAAALELYRPDPSFLGDDAAAVAFRTAGFVAGGLLAAGLSAASARVGSLRAGLARR
jgi:hypothetical protein